MSKPDIDILTLTSTQLTTEQIEEILRQGNTLEVKYYGAKSQVTELTETLRVLRSRVKQFLCDDKIDETAREELLNIVNPSVASPATPEGTRRKLSDYLEIAKNSSDPFPGRRTTAELLEDLKFYTS